MSIERVASSTLKTPGSRIKFLREARDLTQTALANKVYATQPAVSQWENDLWLPAKATQFLIADALHTSRSFLFEVEDIPA